MIRRYVGLAVALLLVAALLPQPVPGRAQESEIPLVVFIEDDALITASIMDTGPDGVSQLETIFQRFGARTIWLRLDEPLPDETRVIVMVRPLSSLSIQQMARLWVQMARGSHLFLTMDPIDLPTFRHEGNARTRPDRARAGLPTLLSFVYGIGLQDTLAVEPWYSAASLIDNSTAHMVSQVEDVVEHPVTAPLVRYELPVQMWGARTMTVDPIGLQSYAVPLLYTETAYGETDTGVINGSAPLEAHIGTDAQGRLFTGALAENIVTGSRVVVLGDSEAVENDYGLAQDGGLPVHAGNQLLVERLVAWLLGRPEEEWSSMPGGFTQVAVDGDGLEWESVGVLAEDASGDALMPRYDISQVRAFTDDSYLYLLAEMANEPHADIRLTLDVENTFDGVIDGRVVLTTTGAMFVQEDVPDEAIPDARMAIDTALEVRLPLRVVGQGALISSLCLQDSRASVDTPPLDCVLDAPILVPPVNTQAPLRVGLPGPRAMVSTLESGVNIRGEPIETSPVIDVVPNNYPLAAVGRTETGDWIQVQTGAYEGWLAAFLVKLNIDVVDLPVTG